MEERKVSTDKQIAARLKRQTKAAKRWIKVTAGPTAEERQHALDYIAPMSKPKHAAKSRNSLQDWPRIGPEKAGGRIPLSGALEWHMLDSEVNRWFNPYECYAGIATITPFAYALHLMVEPLTYYTALRYLAKSQGWREWDDFFSRFILFVCWYDNERKDLRSRRYETDGRKKAARPKFSTRSRRDYWQWLVKNLHDQHKHGWPQRCREWAELIGQDAMERVTARYIPKSKRVRLTDDK